jgi:hypothetical protein
MGLASEKYLKEVNDTPLQYNHETGWQAISKALKLVVWGYCVLIVGGTLGPLLLWLAIEGKTMLPQLSSTKQDRDTLLLLSVLALGLTALFSYGLVLCGQWRCLMYAPQRQNAKELMYVCLNCVVVASMLNVVGVCLSGPQALAVLSEGWDELGRRETWGAGLLLQVGSAVVGLIGSLVFSQFLRNVASCFNDRVRVRRVDVNLTFVGLLLGGSIGTLFCVESLTSKAVLLPWLAGGWLVCFAWHLLLVKDAGRGVEEGLRKNLGPQSTTIARMDKAGFIAIHSLSGLRRLAKQADR